MSQGELPGENVIVAEVVEPTSPSQPRPWGLWATLGLSLAVLVVFFAMQTAVVIGFVVVHLFRTPLHGAKDFHELAESGLLLSVSEWGAAPIALAFVVLLAKLRNQLSVRDYLSLHWVPVKRLLVWSAIVLVYVGLAEGTIWLLEIDTSDVMIKAYRTAEIVPLLWVALVIAAPLFEELFFRGFMFRGIQQSRLGSTGAILITSLIWSAIHFQYDIYQVAVIFGGGILLGIARARSNSTCLTIALHALWNTIAILEIQLYLWQS
jgi:uncharacterized protein